MSILKVNKARLPGQCSTKSYSLSLLVTSVILDAAACINQAFVQYSQVTASKKGEYTAHIQCNQALTTGCSFTGSSMISVCCS